MCVCSLSYPARNALAPLLYCHLSPVWLYYIFAHYVTNGTIFGGGDLLYIKCVSIVFTTLSETFLIIGRIQQGVTKYVHRPSCKVSVILSTR